MRVISGAYLGSSEISSLYMRGINNKRHAWCVRMTLSSFTQRSPHVLRRGEGQRAVHHRHDVVDAVTAHRLRHPYGRPSGRVQKEHKVHADADYDAEFQPCEEARPECYHGGNYVQFCKQNPRLCVFKRPSLTQVTSV